MSENAGADGAAGEPGWRAALLAALPVLAFLPVLFLPPLNQDVAALLAYTERWWNGERLYVDLIDVNPPLIFLLTLPVVALGAWTGLGTLLVAALAMLALAVLAAWLAARVRDRAAEGGTTRILRDIAPALLLVGASTDLGQREHLMALMAWPWLLAATRRMDGGTGRGGVAAGVLAAIGFAIKPYYLAIPVLVELALAARRGRSWWRDPIPWLMGAIWVAYGLVIALFFRPYLDSVLPIAADEYAGLAHLAPWRFLLLDFLRLPLLALAGGMVAAWRWRDRFGMVLALVALGGLAGAMAQGRGWSYHLLPMEMFSGLLALAMLARRLDAGPAAAARWGLALGIPWLLLVLAIGDAPRRQLRYPGSEIDRTATLLQEAGPGARILMLSPDVAPLYPAINYARVRPTLRTMTIWPLQGAYAACPAVGRRMRAPAEMTGGEAWFFRATVDDFVRGPPDFVLLDDRTYIPPCPDAFDPIAYFTQSPLFARVWADYRLRATQGRFRLYARKTP